jgi:UDP-glucose 4-epimerase
MSRRTVLVTGGAGYIGGHAVLALRDQGRSVVVVDDLSTGAAESLPPGTPFYRGNVADVAFMGGVIRKHGVGAVMHFAGSAMASRSITEPLEYYANNTAASLTLARSCLDAGVLRFIFSSSAAVYGRAGASPLREDAATAPINPYGASKWMTEIMLRDLALARPDFRAVCLRYFNVAGADISGRAGQRNPDASSLIDWVVDVALGRRDRVNVWGDDYDTRDGSGERDFVHVSDVAAAHLAAMDYLDAGGTGAVFNCGSGRGHTVLEVIAALEAIVGRAIPTRVGPRRAGDISRSVADVDRVMSTLDWRPRHGNIDSILKSALAWRGRSADSINSRGHYGMSSSQRIV